VGKLFTSKIGQNVYRTEYETDENKTVVLFLVESDETTYLSTEKCESNISLLSQKKAISSLRFEYILAKPKDFNCNGLINVLFKEYGNELFLQADNDQELIFSKLETNIDNYIRDAKLENLLLEEISKFRGRNIQRSYLLYGPPGVGKTIFCSNLAKKISGRILKIDSSVMENLNDESFKNIVRSLKYDFLIIDDIDRIEVRNTPIFLFVLESMKNFPHKPTLLATCNHINSLDKAVLRPGRFDDIMEFNLPDEKERFEFLRKLLLAYGIELSEKEIKEFSSLTANMTQAYLREYVNQLAIENSFDVVKEKIVKRSKYLNMEEDYHAFNSQNR
jgi:SpoVK/Ycf46/Vps4 family AAA+-type ATPase